MKWDFKVDEDDNVQEQNSATVNPYKANKQWKVLVHNKKE